MAGTSVSVEAPDIDGVTLIRVEGELEIQSAPEFHLAVQSCLSGPACKQIRVNLGAVTFCDSTGVGALLEVRNLCAENGVEFVLEGPGPRVVRVLELTGLAKDFRIEP